MGIAYAIIQLVRLGKSEVLRRFDELFHEYKDPDGETTDGSKSLDIQDEYAKEYGSVPNDVCHLAYLFSGLPRRVQYEDIHIGNAPWGIGEALDATGQVRHFMRSRPEITSEDAYRASLQYIRENCVLAWTYFSKATHPDTDWKAKLWDSLRGSQAAHDLDSAMAFLAMTLHTVEDSYAPGHVRRDVLNLIAEVHIWDKDNKEPNGDWPGHEALDNPSHPMSRPFFATAQAATGDLIALMLENLDQSEGDFRTELDRFLGSHFGWLGLPPLSPPGTATA
jgi:hypothetical protein